MLLNLLPTILAAVSLGSAATVPSQLFSNLVPSKILTTTKSLPASLTYPQYTTTAGKWQLFSPNTWTSGFFPATLYALNTRKTLCGATSANGLGAADWLYLGRHLATGEISLESGNGVGHDQGFLSFPFVEELAINPSNQTAITAVNAFAKLLAARYSPIVGATRSWDGSNFQVIIDNMINLELLFVSADLTGNATLRNIAISHANKTMNNHIRADGSTWHVVEYSETTGAVVSKHTNQGYSDSSTWSRGQGWGVYGFANMYKRTGNVDYLATSRRLATWFLDNLPSDGIVPWDFNAPLTPAPRPADSSAATLVVNGLLLLAQVETVAANKTKWINGAIQILNNITALAWNPSWDSLLSNGTVNKPQNNYLTGTVYGDYYFIRAGNELVSMGLASCT